MTYQTRVAMGIISFLLMVELLRSLLANFQPISFRLGATYLRWKNSSPDLEYRLINSQAPINFVPVTIDMVNANRPRQQWILRDEQGHTMILSVQTKGRLRAAGWNHYSFKVLQWHSTKTQDSITFIHRFDRLKIAYIFFYNASGQEVGYAVLYWRT